MEIARNRSVAKASVKRHCLFLNERKHSVHLNRALATTMGRQGTVLLPGYPGWRLGAVYSRWKVMAEERGIYAEDIVKNSQGVVGLVLEDAEETTDESESDEEALKKGQIVVCWYPSGNEETLSLSKVISKIFPGKSVTVKWNWAVLILIFLRYPVFFRCRYVSPSLSVIDVSGLSWYTSIKKEVHLLRLFLNVVDTLNIKSLCGFFVSEGFCCFHTSFFFVTGTISWCYRMLIPLIAFPPYLVLLVI